MQRILGLMRKAVKEFNLIESGDRVLVGVSGGKDSLALLVCLVKLRSFIGIDYDISAASVDPRFGGEDGDYSGVAELCRELEVPYRVIDTQIGEIVFGARNEKNPCSLCAHMRRGALINAANELGCNKLALGHNKDDFIETFMMNLLYGGHIGCFSPKTEGEITLIRPLVLVSEGEIRAAAKREGLPVMKSRCPVDGSTAREDIKRLISELECRSKGTKQRIFGALMRMNN